MIPSDKERFECLRLAVSLFIPIGSKGDIKAALIHSYVIDAAKAFYEFTTNDERKS